MIAGELSVGQLIAFNMLAGQVAAPVVRLAQLWQDFQQIGISVERLGDILNTRSELPASRAALPAIQGRIQFDQVVFRYRPDGPEILRGLSLEIRAGEVIGIVGRSGSGKSTLTKLVQRLYVPESGRVLVDGNDLALADPAWLRRQIGVVLQENLLFNQSIRDNIALAEPAGAAPRDPGGQTGRRPRLHHGTGRRLRHAGGRTRRQPVRRPAPAHRHRPRADQQPAHPDPDEATSALDYESERAIMQNMRAICQGRTVLIIAHRLSTVRGASRIIAITKAASSKAAVTKTCFASPTATTPACTACNKDKPAS